MQLLEQSVKRKPRARHGNSQGLARDDLQFVRDVPRSVQGDLLYGRCETIHAVVQHQSRLTFHNER